MYIREDLTKNNIEKLVMKGNLNHRLFGATGANLKDSQGFYSRLFASVNELDEDGYNRLYALLDVQDFHDTLDVVLWLES